MMKAYLQFSVLTLLFISLFFINKTSKLESPFFFEEIQEMDDAIPNLETFHLKADHLLRAVREINQRSGTDGLAQDLVWLEKGPTNIGGRSRILVIDKRDTTENTVFAAGVSGGLWKTTNFLEESQFVVGERFREGGAVWEPVGFDFPSLGICALVQDPNNLDVLYAGTGEYWVGFGAPGLGIWKSIDGGENWEHLISTKNGQFENVNRLVFDQQGHLYAATSNSGLLKSKDGGNTWNVVLNNSSGTLSNIAADIDLAANGDLYASFGGWTTYGHIYKSPAGQTVGEVGTWERMDIPVYQRKEIACAPSDANRVYVLASDGGVMQKLFVSDDGGDSWTEKEAFEDRRDEQANYNMVLAVSNDDPDYILAGGIGGAKSTNAGDTWIDYPFGPDNHFIVFGKPYSGRDKIAYLVNDRGIYHVWNHRSPLIEMNSESKNNEYHTAQLYSIAVNPEVGSNIMIGGAQDNGVLFFNEPGEENSLAGAGDGGFAYIDEDEPDKVIINTKGNNFIVNPNRGRGDLWEGNRTVLVDEQAAFINASDYDDANNTLYAASFRNSFLRIKNIFADEPSIEYIGFSGMNPINASSVDVSPNDPKRVYFGRNKLYRVNNALEGSSVEAEVIMDENPSGSTASLRNIAIERGNEDHILASMFSTDEGLDYLWETKNSTASLPSWESFHGDLPKIPVYWVIFMPNNTDQALVGTEFGLWITEDIDGANTHWEQCKNGISNVRVTQIVHRESDDRIVAATYGRGVFYTQFFEETNAFFTDKSLTIFESDIGDINDCRPFRDVEIPVELSKLLDEEVQITVSIDESLTTMVEGQDYEILTNNTFRFGPDSALRQDYIIRIFNDFVIEDTERLQLNLTVDNDGANIFRSTYFIELTDDEPNFNLVPQEVDLWQESWSEREFFFTHPTTNPPDTWFHEPSLRQVNQDRMSTNLWRTSELCNPLNVFSAGIWYFNGEEFRYTCGYLDELPSESIFYREVNANEFTNIQVSFDWIAGGDPNGDFGSLVYAFPGEPLEWISLPKQYVNQLTPIRDVVQLPSDVNGKRFYIGWKWENDGNGAGLKDIGFSVDSIQVKGFTSLTKAEIETSEASQYVGIQEDVLYFSDRNKIIAGIQTHNEGIGCTSVDLVKEVGSVVEIDSIEYSGVYLPYVYNISHENDRTSNIKIDLYFDPDSIQRFLHEVNIPQDSLTIYFLKDGDLRQLSKIEGLEFSAIADAQKVSFSNSAQSGRYLLGWLQRRCTNVVTTINQRICFGETFEGYSFSGTYEDRFQAANGCDSTRILNLTILPPRIDESIDATICFGESFLGYTSQGIYRDTLQSTAGCDSIRILRLSVIQPVFKSISETICIGESFEGYSESGTYRDTLQAESGCDSIRQLRLTVLEKVETSFSVSICEGESFEGYTSEGVYEDTFIASTGCDSVRTLNLTVLLPLETTIDKNICEGEEFEGYMVSGIYEDTFVSSTGCDSIRTLNLLVRPAQDTLIEATICSGESFEGYTESGMFEDVFIAANGCDSTRFIDLTVLPDTAQQCVATSISTGISSKEIMIYPNPSEDEVHVSWSIPKPTLMYRFYNGRGKLLLSGNIEKDDKLEIKDFAKGIYWLQLWDGQEFVIKSIVKY